MWTEITRPQYERSDRRHASDLSDAEWGLIAPYMPPPKTLGRPQTTALRDVINAILYLLRSGFPPRSTVQRDFAHWRDKPRGATPVHLPASSTANRSRPPESGAPRGFDAGKKVKGRKRHVFADSAYAGPKLAAALKPLGR